MNEYNYNRSNLRANDSEVTIDLVKVCRHLFVFENILLMVIAGILAGSISFLFSKYCLPELYTSSVAVYVSNNSSLVLTDGIDTQTITGSRNLAESYVVILKQDAVMDEVGNKLFEIYSEEELEEYFTLYISNSENVRIKNIGSYFTIEPIDETEVLKITVVTENPKLSADMCNILVDLAPDFLRGITGGGTVEAIGEAQVPENKSSPNNTKNALLGCFAGVFAVAGVLVLIIIMDNKIRDTESFKTKFEFPVFEEIPYIEEKETNKDNKRKKGSGKKQPVLNTPEKYDELQSFKLAETFNALSNNLIVSLTMNEEKVVVISSPDENDGKSTVSYNLARSMAKLGKKVLLIDLDLRKGSVHKLISAANKNGVIDIVGKKASFESCVKKNVCDGLDVLLTGGISPSSMEILSSKRMANLIEECKEKYDFIIADTPPINVVADACVVSRYAAGVVVVLRANRTRYEDVNRLMENAALANSNIMGFVINFAEDYSTRYGYYKYGRYGYGYGYGYYRAAQKAENEENKKAKAFYHKRKAASSETDPKETPSVGKDGKS